MHYLLLERCIIADFNELKFQKVFHSNPLFIRHTVDANCDNCRTETLSMRTVGAAVESLI